MQEVPMLLCLLELERVVGVRIHILLLEERIVHAVHHIGEVWTLQ